MTINEIKSALRSSEYSFLSDNSHLGSNVILLTVGGSHAYGTDTPTSDLDIRGCALNTPRELLTSENFEQFVNEETDTTIYSFNKLVSLLTNCNPNTIEMLGNKPEHYFYVSLSGRSFLTTLICFFPRRPHTASAGMQLLSFVALKIKPTALLVRNSWNSTFIILCFMLLIILKRNTVFLPDKSVSTLTRLLTPRWRLKSLWTLI